MLGPLSSNSAFVIHMVWKVANEDKIEPPIQTENFLSAGATTLIFIVDGARATISLFNLSWIPSNMVVPPDITMLLYNSFLTSKSQAIIDLKVNSWKPSYSLHNLLGWNKASGHLNLWLATVTMFPSGNVY